MYARRDRIATARALGRVVGACRWFRLYSCIGTPVVQRWRSFVRLVPLFPLSYVPRPSSTCLAVLSRDCHGRSIVGAVLSLGL